LKGKITTVELRNECSVTGLIEHVNGHMDTDMSDVVFRDMFDVETRMEKFYVKGANIRFVLVPDDVNIIETMEKRLKLLRKEGNLAPQTSAAHGRGHSRGRGRGYVRDKAQMKKDDFSGKVAGQTQNLLQKDKTKGKERFKLYMMGKGVAKEHLENVKPKSDAKMVGSDESKKNDPANP
jgi:small nuclear ribonucleoprotein (snRNP)-like protein